MVYMLIVILWVLLAALIGAWSRAWHRETPLWVMLSLILSPVIPVIALLWLGDRHVPCPSCLARRDPKAIVCPNCRRDIPAGQKA